jgi:hypothetical protein
LGRKKPDRSVGLFAVWLPFVDAYRTICIAPSSEARAEFEAIRELGSEA